MKKECSVSGCIADKAYAVVKNNKIFRITFSKSLAELIARDEYEVKRCELTVGNSLKENELSRNGIYAVCKAKSLWPLRITFFQELAELWRNEMLM